MHRDTPDPAWLDLPRYDPQQTYAWNYDHSPEPATNIEVAPLAGDWRLCGWRLGSPLGVPAGPLLNGRWCLYYASLGFDVVTYKTVRSRKRDCYGPPNLQAVSMGKAPGGQLQGGEAELSAADEMEGSWAVSYGMPSQTPDIWRADVAETRARLRADQRLVVSVVGSIQPDWGMAELADDYAACGEAARDAGADAIECNFSCPNVSTCDGQLYQDPESAGLVAARVRERIGDCPLIIKVGHLIGEVETQRLIERLGPSVNAIAATNSIATRVRDRKGQLLFEGEVRGICGAGILEASLQQIERLRKTVDRQGGNIDLIGVGGAATRQDVRRYLEAGAVNVQMATAAMTRPWTALQIRRDGIG